MKIELIPALEDNYIFILLDEDKKEAAVVDPADAELVHNFLKKIDFKLTKIFNTHHHFDHIGGNNKLKSLYTNLEVYAGEFDKGRIPHQSMFLKHLDTFEFANNKVTIYYVPGHTTGHICYHFISNINFEQNLFIGDTLFGGGCGILFEGTYKQLYEALDLLKNKISCEAKIWCTHEYTLENYLILEKLFPEDIAIKNQVNKYKKYFNNNKSSIPLLFSDELKSNLFLRWDDKFLQDKINKTDPLEIITYLRKYRDNPPKINFP